MKYFITILLDILIFVLLFLSFDPFSRDFILASTFSVAILNLVIYLIYKKTNNPIKGWAFFWLTLVVIGGLLSLVVGLFFFLVSQVNWGF